MIAFGHRDGRGGRAFLGLQGVEARLMLPEGPRRVSDFSAGGVEELSKAATFARIGRSGRSCSAVVNSSACWSAVVRTCSIPFSTSWREPNLVLACISGSRLSQTGARCRRWGGGSVSGGTEGARR